MSHWSVVKARLLTLLPDLFATTSGWAGGVVYNGPPVTGGAPTRYVTVGFVVGEDFAGNLEEAPGLGDIGQETGSIRSEVVCVTGAVDLPTVEGDAFALYDAWNAAVKADRTLGVLPKGSTSSLAVDVQPAQTDKGAVQRLTVTLSYTARV